MFYFPESAAVRRLAASLATSLTVTAYEGDSLSMDQSCRVYMRRFPWFGFSVPTTTHSSLEECTVGQFFAQINFDGSSGRISVK